MTKKETEMLVRKSMGKWLVLFDMQNWKLDFQKRNLKHPDSDKVTYAEMKASWEYKTIDVYVDVDRMAKDEPGVEFIEFSLLHELLHTRVGVGFDLARKVFDMYCETMEERCVAELELSPLVRKMIGKF